MQEYTPDRMGNKWSHQYLAGESSTDFPFPIDEQLASWFATTGAGTVVLREANGELFTFVAEGGEIIPGWFTALVSSSCTRILIGNVDPPTLMNAGGMSIETRLGVEETARASADTSIETRFSGDETTITSAETSLATRISIEESTRGIVDGVLASATVSTVTRFSAADSTLTSSVGSITTRVSVEESTRGAGDISVVTRFSGADSTLTSSDGSLATRVSVEESTRGAGDTSVVTRFSSADSTLTSADLSLASRFSSADSTLTSSDASLTTRISVEESTRTAAFSTTENTPLALAMQQVNRQDPFNVQPAALVTFADDMTVTTLTRFTLLADAGVATTTPTIASNLMTFAVPVSVQNNTTVLEGSDIAMPQFFHSLKVSSVTHSGADSNAGENISVGICKDVNNFIFALWQRKQGTFGHVSIQAKIGGVQNLRGDVTLSAALVTPFDLGLSGVANSMTLWYRPNGGTWTVLTSFDVTSDFNLKTSSLTGWKPGFRITTSGVFQSTFNVTNFNVGRFGAVGFRDPCLFSNEDGTVRFSGDQVTLTATCLDPQAAAYCGVFTLDILTYALTQVGLIMVSRGGAIQNDNAAHVIYYNDTTSRLFMTSWGTPSPATSVNIFYKNETSLNLATGANVVASMTQLTLPDVPGTGGSYDPHVVKIGATWYMAHTIGPSVAQTFYPALLSSTDLSTWTAVGSDVYAFPFEGTRIILIGSTYYVLCANTSQINVYDITMKYLGIMRAPLVVASSGAPPHPMLASHGNYVYMVSFDMTLYGAVANTHGQERIFRARRYDLVYPPS